MRIARVRTALPRFSGDQQQEAILAEVRVTNGGWYFGPWLTDADLKAIWQRWADRSRASRTSDEYQCGGCKFFAATGPDWGFCWNLNSPNDGLVMFEHGGCPQHSNIPIETELRSPEGR